MAADKDKWIITMHLKLVSTNSYYKKDYLDESVSWLPAYLEGSIQANSTPNPTDHRH